MAAPFSIGKLISVFIIIMIVLMISLPMIQVAFTPANNTTSSEVNCTAYTSSNGVTLNTNQYNNTVCLLADLGGSNQSALQSNGSKLGYIFNITHSISFNTSTNSTTSSSGGFFAPIFQFTGLSFVFSGIGDILLIMQQLGSIFSLLFGTLWSFMPPVISFSIQGVLKLVSFYVFIRVMIIGVSSWMKFDIWNS